MSNLDETIEGLLSNYSNKQLDFFAFSKKGLYKEMKIPKANGKSRIIRIPTYKLKLLQKNILHSILELKSDSLHPNVTGFLKWKDIVVNAKIHLHKKYILKIDIKDFFPSIWQDRVYWIFRKLFEFNHQNSKYLSGFCTYSNQLPQGAPTSPMLANFAARTIDYRVSGIIKAYTKKNKSLKIDYSRYADDLIFSFDGYLNFNKFTEYIISIIIDEWFFPNYKKIHLFSSWMQQNVTGIIVNNSKVSIWRRRYLKMKSVLFNIQNNGFSVERKNWNKKNNVEIDTDERFKNILNWHLSFMKNASPDYYEKLSNLYKDLNGITLN